MCFACAASSRRTEARWKLEGKKRKPKLVFWRETKNCEGKKGWVVLVGAK
ncbi:MAG: hypothetical protein ACM3MH_09665 [Actinomycetota bacterium]